MKTYGVASLAGVALLLVLASGGYGWQQHSQLTDVRHELDARNDEATQLTEDLELAVREADRANRRAEHSRAQLQSSADAAAEAREAADQAGALVAEAEQAAVEAAAAQAEQAREDAERQAAAAAEAHQRADAAANEALEDACPEGPGEEAAACWAQREGLTLTCPGTDHWVRSLDECTPEALFGPDWEEYVDQ